MLTRRGSIRFSRTRSTPDNRQRRWIKPWLPVTERRPRHSAPQPSWPKIAGTHRWCCSDRRCRRCWSGAGSSRRSLTPAEPGLAATTWTREVSFFGLGASTGRPRTAVSFFASSSGEDAGVGVGTIFAPGGGSGPPGAAPRPAKPGGKLIRTVSFFDSSAGLPCISSAMEITLRNCAVNIRVCPQGCQSVSPRPWERKGRCAEAQTRFGEQWRISYGLTSCGVGPLTR